MKNPSDIPCSGETRALAAGAGDVLPCALCDSLCQVGAMFEHPNPMQPERKIYICAECNADIEENMKAHSFNWALAKQILKPEKL